MKKVLFYLGFALFTTLALSLLVLGALLTFSII